MANVPDNSLPPFDMDHFESFEAEKVSLYVQGVIREAGFPGIADATKLRAFRQAHIDNIVYQLTTWCLAGRVPSNETTVVVEWPDGAWQTFKQTYFPDWLLKQFPVRMNKKEVKTVVNHYFMCPHLESDPRQTHVRFMMTAKDSKGRTW